MRRITINTLGPPSEEVPCKPESNSAGRVIKRMAETFEIDDDLSVTIAKGIPVGSGMGSSGASAAAAARRIQQVV